MGSRKIVSLVAAAGILCAVGGCRRTTYTYNCVDGFVSQAASDAQALAGCGAHGGAINKAPIVTRSSYGSGSSYRSSSRRRSTWSRSKSSTRSRSSSRRRR